MKLSSLKLPAKLQPYRGVIGFAVILFLSNIFWKYNVLGDETDTAVSFWGLDISAPFTLLTKNVAETTASILQFIGWKVSLSASNVIRQETGNSAQLIWACSGLKQAYIFFCILAFSRGPWLKKLWFIPLGLLVVYLFNIFRITFIVASIDKHPDWFEFWHLYFFKYLFYGVIFGMWVIWEEKIVGKELEHKSTV
ncbi:MAG: exosortase/archaeosortase family protein [Paludibacter sp.]|jgi:exosortase/archaeosortase family protein|nr:exosortase/archaeosortase family protein [Paludibacter sp.]